MHVINQNRRVSISDVLISLIASIVIFAFSFGAVVTEATIMDEKRRGQPEEEAMAKEMPTEETREAGPEKRVYVEEREVRGSQILDSIEELIHESTVRRIRVKNKAGRVLVDIPVWAAAVGGVTALLLAPIISAIGVLGGAIAGFKLEIEREVEEEKEETAA